MTTKTKTLKAVIFAGGIGTRMWPLSREATPKQFEKIINNKSTLQLSVERLMPEFTPEDIYISTNLRYLDLVHQQLPDIPQENLIGEPAMRDVAPAVGYAMAILSNRFADHPTAILWSDHLVKNVQAFKLALATGAKYLHFHPDQIIFLGQKPRFPSQNLGWIEFGKEIKKMGDLSVKEFKSWHYRPDLATAEKYFKTNRYAWNPGYFIVTPKFVMNQFKKHAPDMYEQIKQLGHSYGTSKHAKLLDQIYPDLEKVSFDNLILEKIDPEEAAVISVDLGWSDVGAWESLKEALQHHPEQNITHGSIKTRNTTDSLVYSYTNQLVTTIDMEGVVVVVTSDVILVTKKDSIPEVKKLVTELKDTGMEKFT